MVHAFSDSKCFRKEKKDEEENENEGKRYHD